MTRRLVVVGGGILGTMHAVEGTRLGYEVVQLERDGEPRGASVRSFGLVWVSGRAAGAELSLALRAREHWGEIGRRAPAIGFRACGSITCARSEAELAVLEEAASRNDAGGRGLKLLTAGEVGAVCPSVHARVLAGLWCEHDAAVEPRRTLPALRELAASTGPYTFLPGRHAVEVRPNGVRDHLGRWHEGDLVVACVGASPGPFLSEVLGRAPVRRVRLQMLETEPLASALPCALAGGDSLRCRAACARSASDRLPAQDEAAARRRSQLLVVQRADGALTVGDTYDDAEPFPFDLDEGAYNHLSATAGSLFRHALPPVRSRWSGVYSETTDARPYYRNEVVSGVLVVTGLGGRGMTTAPAIAEDTLA